MKKTLHLRIFALLISIVLTFINSAPIFAALPSNNTINFNNQNGIYFYNPDGGQANYGCNTIVANCDIRGNTYDERLWSGIRNYGFTPEQTAALMGNFRHEGGSPVRQEDCYISARNQGVLTQQGNPYTIWTDGSETHSAGMEGICESYKAGNPVAGIGLGPAQWTSKNRREGYLRKMEASGLLKYFEGDAYKTYGRLTDDALREKIVEETGSENDYWALWCAMLSFMTDELHSNTWSAFFNKDSVDSMADYISASYEACYYGCESGGSSNLARRASAKEIYDQYLTGAFNSVENGTASSASTNASGSSNPSSTSSTETGSNVLIIGDSITVRSQSAIESLLPDVTINAEVGRNFLQGLEILESMPQGNIPDILVFALGSNGGATESRAEEVIKIAGSNRQVVFVTDYSLGSHDYTANNALFNSMKSKYNSVIVAEWAAAVSSDPTVYIAKDPDGVDVHPTIPAGTELFAKVLYEAITNGSLHAANDTVCVDNSYQEKEDLPEYLQCDPEWGNLAFGIDGIYGEEGSTICVAGCGPTSFAAMATALLGREILPSDAADVAGKAGIYKDGQGSSWTITETLADNYELQYQDFSTSQSTCVETINNALKDGWMIHTSGTGSTPFSSVGHYIGIAGIARNGDWLIIDSSRGNESYSPDTVLNAGINCNNLKGIKK